GELPANQIFPWIYGQGMAYPDYDDGTSFPDCREGLPCNLVTADAVKARVWTAFICPCSELPNHVCPIGIECHVSSEGARLIEPVVAQVDDRCLHAGHL
ncbi:MAG: hypothetical protein M1335_06115, partial [Chloroflexi bacterium]|nr:hypothetical protein [Chloroflexota bacterium]